MTIMAATHAAIEKPLSLVRFVGNGFSEFWKISVGAAAGLKVNGLFKPSVENQP
jgi:hypothetical protein